MSTQVDIQAHPRIIRRLDGSIFELYDDRYPDPWVVKRGRILQPDLLQEIMSKTKSA